MYLSSVSILPPGTHPHSHSNFVARNFNEAHLPEIAFLIKPKVVNEDMYCFCFSYNLVWCSGLVVLSRDEKNHHTGFDSRLRGTLKGDRKKGRLSYRVAKSRLERLRKLSFTK